MREPIRRWFGLLFVAALASVGFVVATPQPAAAAATVDTVYYWNGVLLDAFRRQGGGPGPLARAAAMMHGAVFDVINSAWWSRANWIGTGYHRAFTLPFPGDPSADDNLAAGIAARDLLIDVLPQQRTFIEQRYTQRHGAASQPAASALAAQVVGSVRSARANDGAAAPPTYTFDNVPGAWRLTGGACTAPVDPHWGRVRPFVMSSTTQFRRPPPGGHTTYAALLASSLYATHLDEVRSLGRINSITRTAQQTQIAFFWANDADGTYKPPGQLLDHTRIVAQSRITDPRRLARLFARVSFAMADAAIAAWDMKYQTPIDLWRPVTAIQLTGGDPTWQPLGATPCFPAWASGHATFAGAWERVMAGEFGANVTFTGTTNDPNAVGVTRTFTSFAQAATENARSRIYLGVHYQFDADDGLAAGRGIGDRTNTTVSQTLNCPRPGCST